MVPIPPASIRSTRIALVAMVLAVLLMAVLVVLLAFPSPPLAQWAGWLFHLNAGVNVAAVVAAFRVLQGVPTSLRQAAASGQAGRLLQRYAVLAAGLMGVSAVVAVLVTWLTGERINLAFLVPFLGVTTLVFPTHRRVQGWMGL